MREEAAGRLETEDQPSVYAFLRLIIAMSRITTEHVGVKTNETRQHTGDEPPTASM